MVNVILEIVDAVSLIIFVWTVYDTHKRKIWKWWKIAILSLVIGGTLGIIAGKILTSFDADFFPLLLTALAALAIRAKK